MLNLNLRVGDRLVRGKGSFSKHHGIYVGYNHQYGYHVVAENNTPHGVQYVTFEQFLDGYSIERVERFKGSETERRKIIPFINSKIGTNYDLWIYNCEHFAHEVQTGKSESHQVQVGVGIGIVAVAFWLGSRP